MAVNNAYDLVEWVSIEYDATHFIEINNVVSWADRVVSPDGDMVYPMQYINLSTPSGVHHNHKYWEMEMVLDTTYLTDHDLPHQHWPYYLDVKDDGGVQVPIRCGINPPSVQNYDIEWLKVYLREGDGTQTELEYADGTADANAVWCTGETAEFNNEIGERHQTITYKFICLQERGKDSTTSEVRAPGTHGYADEGPMKFMRIDEVELGGDTAPNILRFEDEFLMQTTPQFLPNLFQGKDLKQDQRWRVLTLVLDSETTLFDTYIDITTANTVLPNFQLEFTLVDDANWAAGTQQVWAYSGGVGNLSYMLSRREGDIHSDVPRDTIEYRILTACNRIITTVPP